jgi:predicted nucleic acid-binding protein
MSIYADTSFLVSLYAPDSNSTAATKFMRDALLPLILTPLGDLEMFNAFQLRIFRRELRPAEVKSALSIFRGDLESGILSLKSLPPSVFDRAKALARGRSASFGTRSLDVLHVASALVLGAETLCTFDKQQRLLATAEGLAVPV